MPAARTRGLALPQSPFANPFSVQRYGRDEALRLYGERLASRPDLIERARQELAGHDLACWCALDQRCHADVLSEVTDGDSSNLRGPGSFL